MPQDTDFVNRLRQNQIFPTAGFNPLQPPQRQGGGLDVMGLLNAVQSMQANASRDRMIQEDSLHRRDEAENLQNIGRQNAMRYQQEQANPLRAQGGMNIVLGDQGRPGKFGPPASGTYPGVADNYIPEQTPEEQLQDKLKVNKQIIEGEKAVAGTKANSAATVQQAKDATVKQRDETRQANAVSNINLRDKNATAMVDTKEQADEKKKLSADALDKQNKQIAVKDMAQKTLDSLDELIDKDGKLKSNITGAVGMSRLTGDISRGQMPAWLPTTEGRAAKAKVKTFMSQTVLNLIGELKAQSRTGATGFGNMSNKDLAVLESAASSLDPMMSEEDFAAELGRIKKHIVKILEPTTSKTTTDPLQQSRLDASALIKKYTQQGGQ